MSIYPSPRMRDGVLSTVFNKADYVRESNLKNSGVATSSANTTFTGTVNTTRTTQSLSSATFTGIQSYAFNNGMIYSLASNDTPITSLSILNIPTTPLQTYKFTFIIEPSVKSSPYYLKPTSNKILINETSVSLFGLSNIVLPSSYTYLVQEITIMNKSTTTTPSFVALTNVLGYESTNTEALGVTTPIQTTLLIAGGTGTNTIALSNDDGVSWILPSNQPEFTSLSYRRIAFDGKRIVVGGNSNIAYSDDYGITWISPGFNSLTIAYQIIYIPETQIWFAVGNSSSKQTMARSSDGINWTLLSSTTFNRGRTYNIVYNGSVYIATGWSDTYPMATSPDGITWTLNTFYKLDTTAPQWSFCLFYDGSRYIFGGAPPSGSSNPSNIAISQDGITWDDSNKIYLPFDVRAIAYNGVDTYVATGSKSGSFPNETILCYWSNDLINWTPVNHNLIGDAWYMDWNGFYFVITGTPLSGSTVNIIYSTDGKNWTASDNTQFTSTVYGVSSITY